MIFDRVRGALFIMSDISYDSTATYFKEPHMIFDTVRE